MNYYVYSLCFLFLSSCLPAERKEIPKTSLDFIKRFDASQLNISDEEWALLIQNSFYNTSPWSVISNSYSYCINPNATQIDTTGVAFTDTSGKRPSYQLTFIRPAFLFVRARWEEHKKKFFKLYEYDSAQGIFKDTEIFDKFSRKDFINNELALPDSVNIQNYLQPLYYNTSIKLKFLFHGFLLDYNIDPTDSARVLKYNVTIDFDSNHLTVNKSPRPEFSPNKIFVPEAIRLISHLPPSYLRIYKASDLVDLTPNQKVDDFLIVNDPCFCFKCILEFSPLIVNDTLGYTFSFPNGPDSESFKVLEFEDDKLKLRRIGLGSDTLLVKISTAQSRHSVYYKWENLAADTLFFIEPEKEHYYESVEQKCDGEL